MPNVLFVCSANICRSPMAEKFFELRLLHQNQPLSLWQVSSAGTWTTDGHPAAKKAIRAAALWNADLSHHHSRLLTEEILQQQNLTLVMEKSHREALRYEFPNDAKRIFLLSEMIGEEFDIADPYKKSLKMFKACANQIYDILDKGYQRIIQISTL